jgi:hypothetical protein
VGSKRIATRLTAPKLRALPMPEPERLPEHMKMTLREFKRKKRKEALAAERALHELLIGAHFLPRVDSFYIGRIYDDVRRARREWAKWWKNA